MAEITVVGAGYVGLVTAAGFAHLGHDVTCVDVDPDKIAVLQGGEIPIFEDGLGDLVRRGIEAERLRFQIDHDPASLDREFFYLCVPTPQGPDGAADLTYLEAAAAELGPHIPYDSVIVNKSTVPVGSTRFVERVIGRRDIHVVSNPEFLREGSAVADFLKPDRVVIGGDTQVASARVATLYLPLGANILVTDPASAELVKYASNGFLATKLSFVNAVAAVCEAVGADVDDVTLGMGYDHRIGMDFMAPGPGWGGSCFPKDSRAMVRIAENAGYDFTLLRGAIEVNDQQFDRVAAKIEAAAGGLADKTIAMLGVAFKAGTDDTRMSPAIQVARRLIERGATVRAYDPVATVELDGLDQVADAYAACDGAHAVAVLTEWAEFKWLDFAKIAAGLVGDTIVDTRSILDRGDVGRAGLTLMSVGRG